MVKQMHRLLLAIPLDLYERLIARAKSEDRSITNMLVQILRKVLK